VRRATRGALAVFALGAAGLAYSRLS
jgi:hypothetical protein